MVTPPGPPPVPLTPIDRFNEAISIVPIFHCPVPSAHALIIGQAALSAGWVAMRYPQFQDITVVADSLPASMQQPKRVLLEPSLDLVGVGRSPPYQADYVVGAVAQLDAAFLQQVIPLTHPQALVCFAVPVPGTERKTRDLLQQYWPVVTPYRVFLPEPAFFMLCSAVKLGRFRPVPGYTRYLSEGFMPTLFTWSKDELAMLFGATS
jgi:hypothetical protein